MASAFKPTYTDPVPEGAQIVTTKDGKKVARWTNANGKKETAPLTKDGTRISRKSDKWYAKYKDEHGKWPKVPGYTEKAPTLELARKLEKEAALVRDGLLDEASVHGDKTLAEHLADFERMMVLKENCKEHITTSIARIRAVFTACKFTRLSQFKADPIAEHLASRRQAATERPVLPEGQETFGTVEVACLLGIHRTAVHKRVRSESLKVTSTGKRRAHVISRADVEHMIEADARGINPTTYNLILGSLKAFAAWLTDEGRLRTNPLRKLKGLNDNLERRRERRTLPKSDILALLESTSGARTFMGLTGEDRAMLYFTALNTGFRAKELASLTPRSFMLMTDDPTITVNAAYSKRGRNDVQPVRSDVPRELLGYLESKPMDQLVWPGNWRKRFAELVRHDLKLAGIAYADDEGHVFDGHAWRHQYITDLVSSGTYPKLAQMLARHSTIVLTHDRYAKTNSTETRRALENAGYK